MLNFLASKNRVRKQPLNEIVMYWPQNSMQDVTERIYADRLPHVTKEWLSINVNQ